MRLSKALFTLVTTFVTTVPLAAQHWPRFRGPDGSGIADARQLRTSWSVDTSEGVAWKTALPGLGHSSPVVWGDRIFLTTAVTSAGTNTYNAKDAGIQLANDTAEHEWRATVTALAEASLCGHGTGLAAFARSVMAHYGDEVEQCLA